MGMMALLVLVSQHSIALTVRISVRVEVYNNTQLSANIKHTYQNVEPVFAKGQAGTGLQANVVMHIGPELFGVVVLVLL